MVPAKTLLVVCFLVLQCDVTSAAKVNFLRYFAVAEVESEQGTQVNLVENPAPRADELTPPLVPSTAKDAVGLYKVSYEDYYVTWEQFKLEHKRVYNVSEESKRFAIFIDNVKIIERHNWQFHNGLTTYWMDINQFSDWTEEEFQSILSPMMVNKTVDTKATPPTMDVVVADSVDWRSRGYVTGVKNQLQCGSCWAFSATGSLEGQWFAKTGRLIPLSEQQLVDCSRNYGNQGCNGGWMDWAFTYIIASRGIAGETDYPYVARDGVCHYQPSTAKATVAGFTDIPSGSEQALKSAVGSVGPVSVGVAASSNFQHYRGGIFIDNTCTQINHGVLVVGYGTSGSQDYWTVKNSWGTSWGNSGYIYMARNRGNMCQIATRASFPRV
ncbi:unnamed protein product [Candidula unifasciata]|uniref:Uncharacterized protein n=1 Tax=Candidula unifasciata TaxID=100452 RepID=A0A8S3ZIV1_9EUPU|nr:unnamed protein product [Candidula unifasciata]